MAKWKHLPSRVVCRLGRFRVIADRWETPGGVRLVTPLVQSPSFSVVVGVTDDHEIPMVENLHPSPGLRLLELPAGRLEPRETPRAGARRELEEETGWRARRLTSVGRYYPNPHWGAFRGHVFVAEDLSPGLAHPDPGEFVRPVVLPVREVYRRLGQGRIRGGSSLVGLYMAKRRLRELRLLGPVDP